MTIGWGTVGVVWGKPYFTVLVRGSRHTYGLIEASDNFTVSIPTQGKLKEALATCGTKSGRDLDKFALCNLETIPGNKVASPLIKGCTLHYECVIRYKQALDPTQIETETAKKFYPKEDYHTVYYGEIVGTYLEE
jgi:flavin reductase (DIM6/NTAB) family NADH-FMN oxidoreductase RutF